MNEVGQEDDDIKEEMVNLAQAIEKLQSATILLENGFNNDSVSRAYYAVFHAIVGLLRQAKISLDVHKHAFILSQFRLQFIVTGVFPDQMFQKILHIKIAREQSDYSSSPGIDADDATRILDDAKEIVDSVKTYLEAHQISSDHLPKKEKNAKK